MIGSQTFTPPWLTAMAEEQKPKFHFRLATVLERDEFEAELDGRWNAGEVYQFVLSDLAQAGIRALVQGDDADRLAESVRAHFSGDDLSMEEKAEAKAALDILSAHYPDYKIAIEQEARRNRILPTLAFMKFCTGWDNVTDRDGEPVPFTRNAMGEIAEESQRRINSLELRSAGLFAYGLQYGRTQGKNSAPPLKSQPPRKGSRSPGGSKAGGSSANGKVKKTRASGARAGR